MKGAVVSRPSKGSRCWPSDLAHALGLPIGDSPAFRTAIQAVPAAARAYGKAAGILVTDVEQALPYYSIGFTFLAVASDSGLLMSASRQIPTTVRRKAAAGQRCSDVATRRGDLS
jgi:2-keto-3-deoxy-L-rhamnonate aldolase RhmA